MTDIGLSNCVDDSNENADTSAHVKSEQKDGATGEQRPLNHSSLQKEKKARLDKETSTETSLKTDEELQYSCTDCGKMFARPHLLTKHRYVHTGEWPYMCDQCGKGFSQLSQMTSHQMSVHEGKRPFLCKQCGKGFASMSNMKQHARLVHEGQRPYHCVHCGKEFSTVGNMKQHMRSIHEGRRPYHCDVCGKDFSFVGNMNKHKLSIHEELRPYNCENCGKWFTTVSNLKQHVRLVHEGQRPYNCEVCGKDFSTVSNMNKHKRSIHEDQRDKSRGNGVSYLGHPTNSENSQTPLFASPSSQLEEGIQSSQQTVPNHHAQPSEYPAFPGQTGYQSSTTMQPYRHTHPGLPSAQLDLSKQTGVSDRTSPLGGDSPFPGQYQDRRQHLLTCQNESEISHFGVASPTDLRASDVVQPDISREMEQQYHFLANRLSHRNLIDSTHVYRYEHRTDFEEGSGHLNLLPRIN